MTRAIESRSAVPLELHGDVRRAGDTRQGMTEALRMGGQRSWCLKHERPRSPRQYGESMSFMPCAFSRENQLIWSGVRRPDRTLSTSLRCHSRLNSQSAASSTTSTSTPLHLDSLDAREAVVLLDDMADLSAHVVTADSSLQFEGPSRWIKIGPRLDLVISAWVVMRRFGPARMAVAQWSPERAALS